MRATPQDGCNDMASRDVPAPPVPQHQQAQAHPTVLVPSMKTTNQHQAIAYPQMIALPPSTAPPSYAMSYPVMSYPMAGGAITGQQWMVSMNAHPTAASGQGIQQHPPQHVQFQMPQSLMNTNANSQATLMQPTPLISMNHSTAVHQSALTNQQQQQQQQQHLRNQALAQQQQQQAMVEQDTTVKQKQPRVANYRDYALNPLGFMTCTVDSNKNLSFVEKLHKILSDELYEDYVCWLPHGRSWKVTDQKKFEEEVIPRFFRHSKFASFMRQVNGWGFRRMPSGPDRNSYYHEMFLRGYPNLCSMMTRPIHKDGAHSHCKSHPVFTNSKALPPLPLKNKNNQAPRAETSVVTSSDNATSDNTLQNSSDSRGGDTSDTTTGNGTGSGSDSNSKFFRRPLYNTSSQDQGRLSSFYTSNSDQGSSSNNMMGMYGGSSSTSDQAGSSDQASCSRSGSDRGSNGGGSDQGGSDSGSNNGDARPGGGSDDSGSNNGDARPGGSDSGSNNGDAHRGSNSPRGSDQGSSDQGGGSNEGYQGSGSDRGSSGDQGSSDHGSNSASGSSDQGSNNGDQEEGGESDDHGGNSSGGDGEPIMSSRTLPRKK